MSTMPLWRIWLTARASDTKRETISGFEENSRDRTFSAAVLPMTGCTTS